MKPTAQPYTPACRACDAGIERRGILAYKRTANLCDRHLRIHAEELAKDIAREVRTTAVTA